MHAVAVMGRIAVFVNNYVVRVLPGRPTNYGPPEC
jgi:hypothetical protein